MFQQLNIAVLPQKCLKDPDQTTPPVDIVVVLGFSGDCCSFPVGFQPALGSCGCCQSRVWAPGKERKPQSQKGKFFIVSLCHLCLVLCDSWLGKCPRQNKGSVMWLLRHQVSLPLSSFVITNNRSSQSCCEHASLVGSEAQPERLLWPAGSDRGTTHSSLQCECLARKEKWQAQGLLSVLKSGTSHP